MKFNGLALLFLFPFIVSALFFLALRDVWCFCWAAWRQR